MLKIYLRWTSESVCRYLYKRIQIIRNRRSNILYTVRRRNFFVVQNKCTQNKYCLYEQTHFISRQIFWGQKLKGKLVPLVIFGIPSGYSSSEKLVLNRCTCCWCVGGGENIAALYSALTVSGAAAQVSLGTRPTVVMWVCRKRFEVLSPFAKLNIFFFTIFQETWKINLVLLEMLESKEL